MKEIKNDKVFEKKIRIYDIRLMEELNEFYQKHSKEYGNINEYFTSLIRTGLDVEKIAYKIIKTTLASLQLFLTN